MCGWIDALYLNENVFNGHMIKWSSVRRTSPRKYNLCHVICKGAANFVSATYTVLSQCVHTTVTAALDKDPDLPLDVTRYVPSLKNAIRRIHSTRTHIRLKPKSKMTHDAVWFSRPRKYGKGSRQWCVDLLSRFVSHSARVRRFANRVMFVWFYSRPLLNDGNPLQPPLLTPSRSHP